MKEYALYKGDELLCIGTVPEIAKKMGIKEMSLRFLASPTYMKRIERAKAPRVLVRLDEDEEVVE